MSQVRQKFSKPPLIRPSSNLFIYWVVKGQQIPKLLESLLLER